MGCHWELGLTLVDSANVLVLPPAEGRQKRVGQSTYTLRSDEKKCRDLTMRKGLEVGTIAV